MENEIKIGTRRIWKAKIWRANPLATNSDVVVSAEKVFIQGEKRGGIPSNRAAMNHVIILPRDNTCIYFEANTGLGSSCREWINSVVRCEEQFW